MQAIQVRRQATVPSSRQAGLRRGHSLATLQLLSCFQRPVRILATLKHFVSCLYFLIMCFLYFTTSPTDSRAMLAYAQTPVGVLMGVFAALHFHGLVQATCRRRRRSTAGGSFRGGWSILARHLAPSTQLALFHGCDVMCQSYQAYHNSFYLVDRMSAFGFSVVVALNCMVTPWFLLSRHKVIHASVVPLVESFLGFLVSTLFQSVVFLAPAIRFTIDHHVKHDTPFTTRLILLGRCMLVSSPLDLVTKFAIQFSSYATLHKLVQSFAAGAHRPAKTSPSTAHDSTTSSRVQTHFQLDFRHHRLLVVYALASTTWGIALVSYSATATWHREACPATCLYAFAPWWTSTCQCGYVMLNCDATMSNDTDDVVVVDALLRPDQLGTMLFCIDIQRCALPHGIPLATLAPFQNLYDLHITFSNMTDWEPGPLVSTDAKFPPSLMALSIRYSKLTVVPTIFRTLPVNMAYLRLEGASIPAIPDTFYRAWETIPWIALNNLNLTSFPAALDGSTLEQLELRGNRIDVMPKDWLPPAPMTLIDLSANTLVDGPWSWAKHGRVLELSSNPILTCNNIDPTYLTTRYVVLDDTPYCASSLGVDCQSKCNSLCQTKMIGDGRCDWACFSDKCSFDGGDCDSLGFT
ncbi:Aste57867_8461 [Aphanomyces stellatus]|uniref:Aste57867_8461 protein n=1 Tax=Aphanomyces stellatus TaxID=120398 RepID=A0A485KKH4_9STRA|nr:hypothetical protein As57867_008429 [Aphanomyces stellatus]VFT85347.1 Aste57867_8461 [Aphanomyces stellatus]